MSFATADLYDEYEENFKSRRQCLMIMAVKSNSSGPAST